MIYAAVYLLLPSICWWAAARTWRVRLRTAAWLAVVALLQLILLTGAVLHFLQLTLGAALALAAVVVLIRGLVREKGLPGSVWRVLGRILTVVYCVVACGAIVLLSLLLSSEGKRAETPPSSDLLPLPFGLIVTADTDQGCRDGMCMRTITVTGTPGIPPTDVERRIEADLRFPHGWSLVADSAGGVSGRRMRGWFLDRMIEYVDVGILDGQVSVTFTTE